MKILFLTIFISMFSANANTCAKFFLQVNDKIVEAIIDNHGIAMGLHLKYGEGYVTLNKKTKKVYFDQNSHDGKFISNLSYEDFAAYLPRNANSPYDLTKDTPFLYRKQKYTTLGQFADGSILAVNKSNDSLKKISRKDVEKGILALAPQNFSARDKVTISANYREHTYGAHIMEISGIYALVYYQFTGLSGANAPRFTYDSATVELIPLSQLSKKRGKVVEEVYN